MINVNKVIGNRIVGNPRLIPIRSSLSQDGFKKKTEIGKIIGFIRSEVSKFLKIFDQRKNIENTPRTGRPRSTSKQGERTLIRLVKQVRRGSLCDLMNEFNQSVPVPICKRSIQRRLCKNVFHRRTKNM
jgi:hypothetical protein